MESNDSEKSYSHILKYTGIFGGVQGLNILISLVRNKVVASLLGPDGMGLMSLFNSTINFVSQATSLGISFSAVRHVSELFDQGDEERIAHFVKVVRAWCFLAALIGALFCVLAGPLFSAYTFSWGDHTLHFVLLAPAVALTAVAGGETAILKGARKLKSLAVIQIYSVFASLFLSAPLFYFFGQTAIVPVIVVMALITLLLTIAHSYKLYPLQMTGTKGVLGEGMEMVRLGIAFVLAGIVGSGAEILVRSYLNVVGELDIVGLYNVGFVMTMTYGGMVFSAMETDFYPRLSAISRDVPLANQTVNRQIEVSVLIVGPMLVAMLFFIPLMIPILFTKAFMPVVDMMRFTTLALYLRAMKLPVCYMPLARGDGKAFVFIESSYYVVMVVAIMLCFQQWGLTGTGIALLLAAIFEFLLINVFTYFRYQYRPTASVLVYGGAHIAIGIAAFLLTMTLEGWSYWAAGGLATLFSLWLSLSILRKKTSLWAKLSQKFLEKIKMKSNT